MVGGDSNEAPRYIYLYNFLQLYDEISKWSLTKCIYYSLSQTNTLENFLSVHNLDCFSLIIRMA